jgi:hypothetical protein
MNNPSPFRRTHDRRDSRVHESSAKRPGVSKRVQLSPGESWFPPQNFSRFPPLQGTNAHERYERARTVMSSADACRGLRTRKSKLCLQPGGAVVHNAPTTAQLHEKIDFTGAIFEEPSQAAEEHGSYQSAFGGERCAIHAGVQVPRSRGDRRGRGFARRDAR